MGGQKAANPRSLHCQHESACLLSLQKRLVCSQSPSCTQQLVLVDVLYGHRAAVPALEIGSHLLSQVVRVDQNCFAARTPDSSTSGQAAARR